jgi:hypothetical protein
MNFSPESSRARRYLLGEATDDECAVVEQEYLGDEDALDQVAAAEDDLIEDYLAHALSGAERDRFERVYLAAPHHRVRVETVKRLMARASAPQATPAPTRSNVVRGRFARRTSWLALAASLMGAASISFWLWGSFGQRPAEIVQTPLPPAAPAPREAGPAPSPASPRLFAVTLSPIAVRSVSDSPNVVIPNGTDIVAIQFERDADTQTLIARRASVRTVAGREVWQGPVASDPAPSRALAAHVDVPAAQLPADDYLVTLFGNDRSGAEREWAQYFLRVRAR